MPGKDLDLGPHGFARPFRQSCHVMHDDLALHLGYLDEPFDEIAQLGNAIVFRNLGIDFEFVP